MGQLGFSEMLVIFIIALLVFGPKKLPELGKSLGKGIREFRRATEDLKSSWDEQMRDVEAPLKDVTKAIEDTADIEQTKRDMQAEFYQESPAPSPSTPESSDEASREGETAVPKEHV